MNFYIKSCNVKSGPPNMMFLKKDHKSWTLNFSDAEVFNNDDDARTVLYALPFDKTREFYIVSDTNINA